MDYKINPLYSGQGFAFRNTLSQVVYNRDSEVSWVPLYIISDRGTQFTSHFWKSFQKGLGTKVNHNTTFHPQTNWKAERAIKH